MTKLFINSKLSTFGILIESMVRISVFEILFMYIN